ncbi:MAG: biphenyl 2,3-dioxygenase [Gammaproteobacteria bacterium]
MNYRFALAGFLILCPALCLPAEPATVPEGIEVRVSVGTEDGKYMIAPNKLTFERGKYYKLVIHNPSSEDHYFTSDAFATHIFTRKVEVLDGNGKTIAEVHGAVNDLELKPGATVAWSFYPMTRGEKLHVFCHKEGHEAKGMTGSINIIGPPPFSK